VIGLLRNADDSLDELQELSFAIITSLLYSRLQPVKQFMKDQSQSIALAILNYVQVATHKKERPSAENAMECLQ
jgi:hypothetical protein